MAERKVKTTKTKACKRKTSEPGVIFAELDSGECIDLNKGLDYTWDERLTETQRKFIFYYVYPFDNSAKGNGAESARRAGYSEKVAKITASQLQKNAIVMVEIKKFRANTNEKLTKTNLLNQITDFVSSIEKRSKYRVIDYYDVETAVSNEGYEYTKATPKPFDKLTDEQKDLLEGVEYNQRGIPNYKLPNRHECLNDLLKIYKDVYGDEKEKDNDGYDVGLTYSIIKDNVEVRTEIMKKNEERLEKLRHHFEYIPPEAAAQQEL